MELRGLMSRKGLLCRAWPLDHCGTEGLAWAGTTGDSVPNLYKEMSQL